MSEDKFLEYPRLPSPPQTATGLCMSTDQGQDSQQKAPSIHLSSLPTYELHESTRPDPTNCTRIGTLSDAFLCVFFLLQKVLGLHENNFLKNKPPKDKNKQNQTKPTQNVSPIPTPWLKANKHY